MRSRPGLWFGLFAILSCALALAALGRPDALTPPLHPGEVWQPVNDSFGFVISESVVSSSNSVTIRAIDGKLERSTSPAPGAQSRTVLVAVGMLYKEGVWHRIYATPPSDALTNYPPK